MGNRTYTPDPRLDSAQRLRLQIELNSLGQWPEKEAARKRIQQRLNADTEARKKDKAKGRY